MSEPLGIALVGCGTVGGGVAKILLQHKDRLAPRAGRPLALRKAVVRDPLKPPAIDIPKEPLPTDPTPPINHPPLHVVPDRSGAPPTAKKTRRDAPRA